MDRKHLSILARGVQKWNEWRARNPNVKPDLSGASVYDLRVENASEAVELSESPPARISTLADFGRVNLSETDLTGADLRGVNLNGANLSSARLSGAILEGATLQRANLRSVDARHAHLSTAQLQEATLNGICLDDADLSQADLSWTYCFQASLVHCNCYQATLTGVSLVNADCTGADFRGVDLRFASLVNTTFTNADLSGAKVFGSATWGLTTENTLQRNIQLNDEGEDSITVDNLEVAQFIHLLLNNQRIRQVIDTITSKVVLILGRFTPERKAILDALREELRRRDYLPILFDFEKPTHRDLTETVSTLAHMARFVIADITDAKSIPQELLAIVPNLPSVPVQPLLLASQQEYGMFEHFRRFPWVLEPVLYDDQHRLLASIGDKVIRPAEARVKELL